MVEIEVTNPLKDRGQNILEGATKAHVCDEEQKGQLVVKSLLARKELDMHNVCEDDASENDNANYEACDVEADKN